MSVDEIVLVEPENAGKYVVLAHKNGTTGYVLTDDAPSDLRLKESYDTSRPILRAQTDDEKPLLFATDDTKEFMKNFYESKITGYDERNPYYIDVEFDESTDEEVWSLYTRNLNFVPSYDSLVSVTRLRLIPHLE